MNPPSGKYHVRTEDIIGQIRDDTKLICIMAANNETGAIQPVVELGENLHLINEKRSNPIKLLVDASQAIGKINVNVLKYKCDYCVIAGHKFYGPRIGALWARDPASIEPFLAGGSQENGMRPGTENTAMIAGLGMAAEIANFNLDRNSEIMRITRDKLKDNLLSLSNEVLWLSGNIYSKINQILNIK